MKTVLVYETADGRRFATASAAEAHEHLLEEIRYAEAPLGDRPSDCDFSNGRGYLAHTPEAVAEAIERADALVRKRVDARRSITDQIVGRILSDGGSPIYDLWNRISCIDAQGREWGQRYYALNPTEGVQQPWATEQPA